MQDIQNKPGRSSINLSRRDFLIFAIALSGGFVASPWLLRLIQFYEADSKEIWDTLSLVQEHLFPKEQDSPGAKDINAAKYLKSVLKDSLTDTEEKEMIFSGIEALNYAARETTKKKFIDLSWEKQEELIHEISETSEGEQWLSTLIIYILEALFSDPVYGGNPDGVGWKWIRHTPGYPRPRENKRYFELRKL